jgi:hypothetical protein
MYKYFLFTPKWKTAYTVNEGQQPPLKMGSIQRSPDLYVLEAKHGMLFRLSFELSSPKVSTCRTWIRKGKESSHYGSVSWRERKEIISTTAKRSSSLLIPCVRFSSETSLRLGLYFPESIE